jgi:hypothetical protein
MTDDAQGCKRVERLRPLSIGSFAMADHQGTTKFDLSRPTWIKLMGAQLVTIIVVIASGTAAWMSLVQSAKTSEQTAAAAMSATEKLTAQTLELKDAQLRSSAEQNRLRDELNRLQHSILKVEADVAGLRLEINKTNLDTALQLREVQNQLSQIQAGVARIDERTKREK